MIIRIVKMTFEADKIDDFLKIFDESKEKIEAFDGCSHVELLNDVRNPNIYFTYSIWASEDHLNTYRNSKLFKTTWATTKALFADKSQAWSLEQV